MKILQIRGAFEDNGPGSQTLTISEELRKRGHDVVLCCSGGMLVPKIKSKGFQVSIIPELAINKRNLFSVIKAIKALRSFLKENEIEIVHAHNAATLYLAYVASRFLSVKKKIKFFHSCRGVELRENYQWRNWIYKGYPAHLFAVCEFTQNILMSFGVKKEQITITYNGVDLERFDISKIDDRRKAIREELNIPEDAFVVGIIGRMGVKGHDILIKAFNLLYKKYDNLYTVLVGEGETFESNNKLAKDFGITDRTIFTGFRTDAEMLNAGFDIFALLSTEGEMFPNAILESMAYGHPFIASRLSGIPEMAKNNEGFLVTIGNEQEVAERIEELIKDTDLRYEMGKHARESVINVFNIVKVVDKIENAYQ
ncbi:glycosyltransferase [Pedobacter montanisoli]|uniref:Glycosyltransferase n=1 Tax=Pedobacter montanisoli TaxID=2923277 RepID=A0ABS9ZSM0_9SPHI|nr:glycosyltransferase [Pedobacter montanisoli]MCJ0741498.1 glycosyltransferase [Pedobacter montanisoli]